MGTLGALLRHSWALLGRAWGALGALLDGSWMQLGKKAVGMCFLGSNLEAKIHPSWLQNPGKIDIETNVDFKAFVSQLCACLLSISTSKQKRGFCEK